jgi:hypothetical protein
MIDRRGRSDHLGPLKEALIPLTVGAEADHGKVHIIAPPESAEQTVNVPSDPTAVGRDARGIHQNTGRTTRSHGVLLRNGINAQRLSG